MNAEMPPFKNGEHNSESASTIDRVITPLKLLIEFPVPIQSFEGSERIYMMVKIKLSAAGS